LHNDLLPAPKLENTVVEQKYFKEGGGANARLGDGQKYTKYSKINNTSENLRGGKIAAPGPPLVAGLSASLPLRHPCVY